MIQNLPILGHEKEIVDAVRGHQVVVVAAETGAGKSTQLPLMLLRAGFGQSKMIGITQPRRIAAVSVSSYVAELHGTSLGQTIGFQIRNESELSSQTRVKFMTEGILLRELHSDKELSRYEVVIVDEAHERGVNQDLILALLKFVIKRRSDLKVVIMSATIDEERFAEYFGGAPIIKVPGRMFPVETRYSESTPYSLKQAVEMAVAKVNEIVSSGQAGDILVFLPDEKTIREACNGLESVLSGARILPLYGSQSPSEQRAIFRRDAKRRIIVATNIAETSVTIDGIVHVVDTGFIKAVQYVNASMSALQVIDHSQAGCNQRAGRAGRTQPGVCHRMYTEDDFVSRQAYTEPELLRMALDQVLLHLRVLGYSMDEVVNLELMDNPGQSR